MGCPARAGMNRSRYTTVVGEAGCPARAGMNPDGTDNLGMPRGCPARAGMNPEAGVTSRSWFTGCPARAGMNRSSMWRAGNGGEAAPRARG